MNELIEAQIDWLRTYRRGRMGKFADSMEKMMRVIKCLKAERAALGGGCDKYQALFEQTESALSDLDEDYRTPNEDYRIPNIVWDGFTPKWDIKNKINSFIIPMKH